VRQGGSAHEESLQGLYYLHVGFCRGKNGDPWHSQCRHRSERLGVRSFDGQ
jgi:hypothetical protein